MATMTISLPDPMKEWVEAQIRTGDYASSSDYVRDLIRKDREQRDRLNALRTMIDEAEASGISPRSVDEGFRRSASDSKKPSFTEWLNIGLQGEPIRIFSQYIFTRWSILVRNRRNAIRGISRNVLNFLHHSSATL
jgi:antitoxin ParD1/3/4